MPRQTLIKWCLYCKKPRALFDSHLIFAARTEAVAQLVRASDCGSEGRGFETLLPPQISKALKHIQGFFVTLNGEIKPFFYCSLFAIFEVINHLFNNQK